MSKDVRIDKEKVIEIYFESQKIIRSAYARGDTKTNYTPQIIKVIKEVVDNED